MGVELCFLVVGRGQVCGVGREVDVGVGRCGCCARFVSLVAAEDVEEDRGGYQTEGDADADA